MTEVKTPIGPIKPGTILQIITEFFSWEGGCIELGTLVFVVEIKENTPVLYKSSPNKEWDIKFIHIDKVLDMTFTSSNLGLYFKVKNGF